MKRMLLTLRRGDCGCCPGHDKYPCETYRNRRSKKARSRDIKREHRLVRRTVRMMDAKEISYELAC